MSLLHPQSDSIIDTHSKLVNEKVVYQNPLLMLKIWEIFTPSEICGIPTVWPWHYHKEVEVLAVIEGYLGVQTKRGYTKLGPGDVMIIGASQPHRSHKPESDEQRYVVFQIDLSKHIDQTVLPYLQCFSELTRPLDGLNYIFEHNRQVKQEVYDLIMLIHQESQARLKGYEIAISAAIKQFMLLLLRNDTRNVLIDTDEMELHRLKPVLDYIDEHLVERITVEDACEMLNLSYHYFVKYFKKTMGMSFLDYINRKRIKKAERLLLTTELSIMEVGFEVGIANMAQFYKLFKRHNQCSPKEFKQRVVTGLPK